MSDHERVPGGTVLTRPGGLIPGQPGAAEHTLEQVHDALRTIPSHGWPAGWLGRRDRALLVLSELAGLSYEQIANLVAGDLNISRGMAVIRTTGGTTRLSGNENGLLCGPCALARWVHALDLTVVYPDSRVIAAVIGRAVPLTANSPHLCDSNNDITEITRRVPLLPPIDRWGHPVRSDVAAAPADRSAPNRGRGTVRLGGMAPETLERAKGLHHRVGQLLDLGPAA